MPHIQDIGDWQGEIGKWADKTFPKATEVSILNHLKDEVENELVPGCDGDELADVVFLVLYLAHKRGICLGDEMRKKFAVNRERKWETEPNEKGFMEHIK